MSGTTLLSAETLLRSFGNLNASAPVILGGLVLQGVEVPSSLTVAGEQALTIHKLVGGDRVIQAMGPDPAPITLAGMFTGPGALARALQLSALRDAGQPLRLGYAGVSLTVVIRPASYTYTQKGAVIPFQVTVEVQPSVASSPSASPSALSSLVGPDVASGITTISNTLATVSAYAGAATSEVSAIVGQVMPLASLVGAGGLLAGVADKLTVVGTLVSAGTNFAAAPAAAAATISGLQGAGTALMGTIGQAGANLQSLSAAAAPGDLVADMPSLMAAIANAGALSTAATAGGYLNRATTNTELAAGLTPSTPVIHA